MLIVYLVDESGVIPEDITEVSELDQIVGPGVYDIRYLSTFGQNEKVIPRMEDMMALLRRCKEIAGDVTLYQHLPPKHRTARALEFFPDLVYIWYKRELSIYRNKFGPSVHQRKLAEWLNGAQSC